MAKVRLMAGGSQRVALAIPVILACAVFTIVSMTAAGAASARPVVRPTLSPEVGAMSLSNWAGYIAAGTTGEFTTASADWVVASVTCLSNQDLYAPWVGIDGYGDATVEQTGVETTCASGSPVSEAWYELYPKSPVFISEPVSTGDAFSASVSYSTARKKFTVTITDVTKGWTKTVTKAHKSAKRMSAEAVIEAPGSVKDYPSITGVNFTDVLFNGADLSTFSPVPSDSGNPVVYAPGPITSGTNFTIAPTT
ncbi:MAG TPA: G1 family glutamic endopeptidase [Acidimicrobiales bacterium]|nr:G1 family glutamic endopeptidase [Acidimicrobiales bacterium]